jgi:hypothetical protein
MAVRIRKEGDLYKTADGLGSQFINVGHPQDEGHLVKLNILGLALCEGSNEYLELYINVLDYAVKKFLENPGKNEITSEEIKTKFGLSDVLLKEICELVYDGYPRWTSGATKQDSKYSFNIDYSILEYEGIQSVEEFLTKIDKKWLPNRFGGERDQMMSQMYSGTVTTQEPGQQYILPNLDFMKNPQLKDLVRKDLEELFYVMGIKAWKSVTILSGSIVEFVLFDYFLNDEQQASRSFKHKWPKDVALSELISQADLLGLISKPDKPGYDMLRLYRNLIHPNSARTENRPDEYVAVALFTFVHKIIRDMSERQK